MDLNEIAVFVKVVQTGSFSGAAKQLGMPNSTVSSKVSALEERLGTTLIQRTTRKLNITPTGEAFFRTALEGLEKIGAAEDELRSAQMEPQGVLRLTAPVELGNTVLPQLITDFSAKYPLVTTEIILTDRRVDLLAESIDLAIRAGQMKDSSFIAKKLGDVRFAPFASTKYLKTAGTPRHPKDLKAHRWIRFAPFANQDIKLFSDKSSATIKIEGPAVINDLNLIKQMTINGAGIAMLPTFFCMPEVKAGKLIRLLPEWSTDENPVHFVYPAQKHVSRKLSAFIAFATDPIRKSLTSN